MSSSERALIALEEIAGKLGSDVPPELIRLFRERNAANLADEIAQPIVAIDELLKEADVDLNQAIDRTKEAFKANGIKEALEAERRARIGGEPSLTSVVRNSSLEALRLLLQAVERAATAQKAAGLAISALRASITMNNSEEAVTLFVIMDSIQKQMKDLEEGMAKRLGQTLSQQTTSLNRLTSRLHDAERMDVRSESHYQLLLHALYERNFFGAATEGASPQEVIEANRSYYENDVVQRLSIEQLGMLEIPGASGEMQLAGSPKFRWFGRPRSE